VSLGMDGMIDLEGKAPNLGASVRITSQTFVTRNAAHHLDARFRGGVACTVMWCVGMRSQVRTPVMESGQYRTYAWFPSTLNRLSRPGCTSFSSIGYLDDDRARHRSSFELNIGYRWCCETSLLQRVVSQRSLADKTSTCGCEKERWWETRQQGAAVWPSYGLDIHRQGVATSATVASLRVQMGK
jgi:hypothetical protein